MKKYKYWLLLLLIPVIFIIIYRNTHKNHVTEKVVAVVNGDVISYKDLQKEVIFSSMAGLFNSNKLKLAEKKKIEKNVLEDLVIHTILLQKARKLNITISDSSVKNYISNLVEGLSQSIVFDIRKGDSISISAAINHFYQLGLNQGKNINLKKGQFYTIGPRLYFFYPAFNEPDVITFTDTNIESIVEFKGDTFVYRNEIKIVREPPLYSMLKKSGINYATWRERVKEDLIIDRLIKKEVYDKIKVKYRKIQQEYKNNKDKYYQPEKYEIRQIFIPRSYNSREDKKQIALARRLRNLLVRRRATFSKLAIKYSKSPEAKNGGYMGHMSLSQLPVEFSFYLRKMRTYQISKIIETPFGYHIVQLLDKTQAYNKPLSEVRSEIVNKLKRKKEDKMFSKWLTQLEKESIVTIYYNYFGTGG